MTLRAVTTFKSYIPVGGGEKVFAAQLDTEAGLQVAREQWKLETARLGDFIILLPNGGVQVYGELDFGETHDRAPSS